LQSHREHVNPQCNRSLLLMKLADETLPDVVKVGPELVVRESTGRACSVTRRAATGQIFPEWEDRGLGECDVLDEPPGFVMV
jgi:hypothetical protein